VLNPHQVWLMVVLISAVSLGFAQRSRQQPEHAPALARPPRT